MGVTVSNIKVSNLDGAIRAMRQPMSSFSKSDSAFGIANIDDLPDYEVANKWALKKLEGKRPSVVEFQDTEDAYHHWLWEQGILNRQDDVVEYAFLGPEDFRVANNLCKAGAGSADHRKFLRQINVCFDVTAPVYWVNELATYKVGTTMNSSSMMHKGASRDYTLEDFTLDIVDIYEVPSLDKDDPIFRTSEEVLEDLLYNINALRKKYNATKDYKYFRAMRQLMPMGYNYTFTFSCNYEVLANMYYSRCFHPHRLKEWAEFGEYIEKLPYFKELVIDNMK